ncbi:hypothetical protein CEXT_690221 [Caerostris extrusa]|uniref:Uncharacterized protein n=1 Tax=Caerostris extrusa TaxID=172846 RepID=A0AAV4WZ40_CAEEX|nr:hypothetical protein CEXT_690221 [Caerostris extrusa]
MCLWEVHCKFHWEYPLQFVALFTQKEICSLLIEFYNFIRIIVMRLISSTLKDRFAGMSNDRALRSALLVKLNRRDVGVAINYAKTRLFRNRFLNGIEIVLWRDI